MVAALPSESRILLKRIGLEIQNRLYLMDRSVEWLSFESRIARSTLREIIAGRSDPRILTLHAISKTLGCELSEILAKALSARTNGRVNRHRVPARNGHEYRGNRHLNLNGHRNGRQRPSKVR